MPASPDGRGHGRLYSIASGERPVEWRRDIGIANTFCWSPGGRTLYTGDTIAGELRAYAVDPATGAIADERPFFAGFDRGHPDGSAIDEQGHLYNCRYGGGCIVRVDPEGRIERIIEMPVKNITTATFGGPDLTTLLVTTSSLGRAAGDRLAGGLFAIETDVRGLPENRFAL